MSEIRHFDRTCTILVRWSDEDEAWLASCPELAPCTADGLTIAGALKALDDLIDVLEDE